MKTKEWYNRKSKDVYIKKASKLGFVSRSAFKLIEIEKKYKLIKLSKYILELGSSPGGWTQVISNAKTNQDYSLICIDKNDLEISTNKNRNVNTINSITISHFSCIKNKYPNGMIRLNK